MTNLNIEEPLQKICEKPPLVSGSRGYEAYIHGEKTRLFK